MNLTDANLIPWLIPIPPLVAFALIILGVGRSKPLTHMIAVGAIAISWLLSLGEVITAMDYRNLGSTARGVFGSSLNWLSNGSGAAGSGALRMGVMVDPLTAILLFMVPLACLLIFIYSLGYMENDPRNTRFFAYLSLFAGAMLTLVVADNLLLLFIGWEVMGLCSYLLIGFWYEKESAYKAAIKAFMTTRVADVIFLIGIVYLWASTGTLNFRAILNNPAVLHMLGTTPAVGGLLGLTAAGAIGICIVVGTIGKSAQFPLHVWLPDAMEGPTPVSAMIHAATMVSAGVYLVIRMYPVLSAAGNPEQGIFTTPMALMAVVGAFTALFAATIAITQTDIKRVLAYSTISQFGFMIAALGRRRLRGGGLPPDHARFFQSAAVFGVRFGDSRYGTRRTSGARGAWSRRPESGSPCCRRRHEARRTWRRALACGLRSAGYAQYGWFVAQNVCDCRDVYYRCAVAGRAANRYGGFLVERRNLRRSLECQLTQHSGLAGPGCPGDSRLPDGSIQHSADSVCLLGRAAQ